MRRIGNLGCRLEWLWVKVMLVNGSPHRAGCTAAALGEVAAALGEEGIETETHWLGGGPVPDCIDCRGCSRAGRCVVADDVNELRERAAGADGFVFGTPVYYASASGRLRSFMDRLFFSDLWGGHGTFSHKPAAAVAVARRAGTTNAYDEVNKYFGHSQMPIVTSTYWNLAFGTEPGQARADAEGMRTMRNLGRNMAWLLRCIEAGRAAGVAAPEGR